MRAMTHGLEGADVPKDDPAGVVQKHVKLIDDLRALDGGRHLPVRPRSGVEVRSPTRGE